MEGVEWPVVIEGVEVTEVNYMPLHLLVTHSFTRHLITYPKTCLYANLYFISVFVTDIYR